MKKTTLIIASTGALTLVAIAALAGTPLNQAQWATLLAERTGRLAALPKGAADQSIALLAGRPASIDIPASKASLVVADGGQKTWRYDVATTAPATWLLVAKTSVPAFVAVDKTGSRLIAVAANGAGSDAGTRPLLSGNHSISVHAAGTTAPDLTLVGGCSTVAPAGGWAAASPTTWGLLSRTLVQALGQGGRLPAAEGLAGVATKDRTATITVDREGTYTVLLSGKAVDRATYRLDGCDEVRPAAGVTADGWREGATAVLTAGEHTITLFGSDVSKTDGKVRLVKRTSTDAEYLAVLQGLGVKLPTETASVDLPEDGVRVASAPGVHHAKGDAKSGLATLANRAVTREEANAVLETPGISHRMSEAVKHATSDLRTETGSKRMSAPEEIGTFDTPISPTVPDAPDAQ